MNAQEFKNARTLKENLATVLYQLQHLKVDGNSLIDSLKVNDHIKMSAEGEMKEQVTHLKTALALSEALVSITEKIETPRNSGVSGAIYQANNNKKRNQ
ncbi:hypothetical protein N9562_00415 [Flavobacteriaceae bacterium]|nr:hypothetical protein [Flavobacteriaceae bacterium]